MMICKVVNEMLTRYIEKDKRGTLQLQEQRQNRWIRSKMCFVMMTETHHLMEKQVQPKLLVFNEYEEMC